jgi:hypothetical protein
MMAVETSPMRTFDPVRLGHRETDAWVAYYRRRWLAFLSAAIGMVRIGFGLGIRTSVTGAWYVLRANQLWAPWPDNDPAGARTQMLKFYRLIRRTYAEHFDVETAATLEIAWWRAHREHQHPDHYPAAADRGHLVDALAALYAHVYSVPAATVYDAAAARAEAMDISDRWVAAGCDPRSPLIDDERHALIRGYRHLRDVVGPV